MAVIYDRKLIKAEGYGILDRELNVKTRPSSIFPIASISKPLTATAVMLLVQDGVLDLDAPIGSYLSEIPEQWESVTLRQLLAHTAGLSEAVYGEGFGKLATVDGFIAEASSFPLDFQPGESWMYSNTGYNLAAAIVEKVSGQSFESFLETRIFEPLDMNNTDVLRESYQYTNRAMGYWERGISDGLERIDINFNMIHRVMPMFRGAGSVTSNVVDLAKWAISIEKGELLSPELQAEMQQQVQVNSGLFSQYGLGWFLRELNGREVIAHGGNLWGYSTAIARFPDDQLTVILLTNKHNESGTDLARKIAEQYVPALATDWDADAIADPAPDFTAALTSFLEGSMDAVSFTPETQIALTTVRGQLIQNQLQRQLEALEAESLALISQEDHPNGTQKRYRAVANGRTNILTVVLTPDGLINTMGISEED